MGSRVLPGVEKQTRSAKDEVKNEVALRNTDHLSWNMIMGGNVSPSTARHGEGRRWRPAEGGVAK